MKIFIRLFACVMIVVGIFTLLSGLYGIIYDDIPDNFEYKILNLFREKQIVIIGVVDEGRYLLPSIGFSIAGIFFVIIGVLTFIKPELCIKSFKEIYRHIVKRFKKKDFTNGSSQSDTSAAGPDDSP